MSKQVLLLLLQGVELFPNPDQGIIMSTQSLVLQKVVRNSSGEYSCQALNSEGMGASSSFSLHIMCEYIAVSFSHSTVHIMCEYIAVSFSLHIMCEYIAVSFSLHIMCEYSISFSLHIMCEYSRILLTPHHV